MDFLTGQRNTSVDSLLRYLSTLNPDEKLYPVKMNGEERTTRANQISVELDTIRRIQSILLLQNKALWSDITSDKNPPKNVRAVSKHVARLLNADQKVGDFIKALNTIKHIPLEIKSPPHTTITAGVKSVLQQLIRHPHIHADLYGNACSRKVYADDRSRRPIGILPRYDIFGSQVLRVLQCVEDAYHLNDDLEAQNDGKNNGLLTQTDEVKKMRQDICTWILELKKYCNPNKWRRTDSNAETRKSVEHTMALDDSERSEEKTRQDLLRNVLNDIFGNRSLDGSLASRTGIHQYKDLIGSLSQKV